MTSDKKKDNSRKRKDSGANRTIYSTEAIQSTYKQRRKLRAPSKTITRTCDQWLFKHFFNSLKCSDADFKRLFFHFWITYRHSPQKRSHLSVSILPLDISMNSYWFETGTGKKHSSYCWYRKVSTTNKGTLLLHSFYSKECMCNDYSPAIEWLKA